jgi:hypothetical protein
MRPYPLHLRATSSTLARATACLVLCLSLGLLGACGGTKRVLGPPGMSVQEVELTDGHYYARVRLDSPASMPLVLERLDWTLTMDGKQVAKTSTPLTLTLAPVAGDVVRLDLGTPATLPRLAALGPNDSLAYLLEGELKISSPSVHYPIRYEGHLRPTPGKPGSFR